jgi:hypothetical protein
MKRLNLVGKKFKRLKVIEFSEVKNGNSYWKCLCDCGNICIVSGGALKKATSSCGCIKTYKHAPAETGINTLYSILN